MQSYFCKADYRCQFPFSSWFTCDNVPFFGRSDYDLRLVYFLPCQLHITGEFPHFDPKPSESLAKLARDFRCECFHWGHIDDFESVPVDIESGRMRRRAWRDVLRKDSDDGHDRYVSFTLSSAEDEVRAYRSGRRCRQHRSYFLYAPQINMFSFVPIAVGWTMLCIRFKVT